MEENIYYVYVHTSPSNKKYVGITRQNPDSRWRKGFGYLNNKHFYNAILKYGWDNFTHEIVASNLSRVDALHMEENLVSKYDSFKNGYNSTPGGDGLIGKPTPNQLRKHSKNPRAHPVCQYTITGEYIASYHTIADASEITGVAPSNISSCARGDREYAGGYLWAYEGDDPHICSSQPDCYLYGKESFLGGSIPLKPDYYVKGLHNYWASIYPSVTQYDLKLNKIADYDSVSLARAATGCCSHDIYQCIRGERLTCGGYYWTYKGESVKVIKPDALSPLRTIYQIDKYSKEIIATYKNLRDAEMLTGIPKQNISKVCNQMRKSAGGYFWMYEDSKYILN